MSYNSTWLYLRQLTTQARYTDAVRSGRWLWVYDNLNIHQRVRHERTGKGNQWLITLVSAHIVGIGYRHILLPTILCFTDHHSDMLNLTSCIAVQIQNLPEGDVNWADCKSQKPRSCLTASDFLPDDNDATQFHKQAVQLVMEVLVNEFKSLHDLQPHLPERESPHPVKKSMVVPMEILFKDEIRKADTIEILSDLMKDSALTGEHQVKDIIHMLLYNVYHDESTTDMHVFVC